MILESKELEIAAIAISMAAGCIPCTRFHIREADSNGASAIELMHIVKVALSANRPSDLVRAADTALAGTADRDATITGTLVRQAALAGIGIAVCGNSVAGLRAAIAEAGKHRIADDEIMEIFGLASRIKEKAASHLDRIADDLDADRAVAENARRACV